jgi:hypothetical protein
VITDNEKPTITCNPNIIDTTSAGDCFKALTLATPITADNCGVLSTTSNAPANLPVGTTSVIWTVTDVDGNTNFCTQTITIVDAQKPSIVCQPDTIITNPIGCIANGITLQLPTTTDNCGIASIVDNYAGTTFNQGVTTITYTVTDVHGNTNTCKQKVYVICKDTIKVTPSGPNNPIIVCPTLVNLGNPDSVTTTTCGTPGGYTASTPDSLGCITYTPTGAYNPYPDTTCIVICSNGVCDTQIVIITPATQLLPDANITNQGVPVNGALSTNDNNITIGTAYKNPKPNAANPSADAPMINADGTYSFVSNTPGSYTFVVPVVLPNGDSLFSTLKITVLPNPSVPNPAPIANPDIVGTPYQTSVIINTLANDAPAPNGAPINVAGTTIDTPPANGTATVNPTTGQIDYLPAQGFSGVDVLTYQIIDGNGKTATATQTIIVKAPNASNITLAADDYNSTSHNTTVYGNVLPNDSDPEGDNQFVVPQSFTFIAGAFALDAGGNYTVTPPTGFSGTLQFPYTIYDDNALIDSANATLYVYVGKPIIGVPDMNVTYVNVPVSGNVSSNDGNLAGASYGAEVANANNPDGTVPFVNPDGTYTFSPTIAGIYNFTIQPCPTCVPIPLKIVVIDSTSDVNPPIVNTDVVTTLQGNNVIISTLSNDGTPNSGDSLNPASVTITQAPKNGTAVIDPLNGNIGYTPNAGFVGIDTLEYNVCNSNIPPQCDKAYQIITVLPINTPNTTNANDDFKVAVQDSITKGSVSLNDNDPEGDAQSTIAFTLNKPGKGTLTMDNAGNYTFTPEPSFVGTVTFPYTVVDDNAESASSTATIYIIYKGIIFTQLGVNSIVLDGKTIGEHNELVWITNQEKNIANFVIQHSTDGLQFKPLGDMPSSNANGTSAGFTTYTYTDLNVAPSNHFYKILALDINGYEQYSNTILLTKAIQDQYLLFPNPAADYVNLDVTLATNTSLRIKMLDASGKVVKIVEAQGVVGQQQIQIDISSLATGLYHIQLWNNNVQTWNTNFRKQ